MSHELVEAFEDTGTVIGGFLQAAPERGLEPVPPFAAYATPAGVVTSEAFRWLTHELSEQMERAGQVEGVFLEVHGAMVGQDPTDPEDAILRLVRRQWPRVPVACVLDLHANLGRRRFDGVEVLTGYRTNPHVDTHETGRRAASQLAAVMDWPDRPYRAHRGLPLIVPPVAQRTDTAPLKHLLDLAWTLEREMGLLDVTVHAGFAYADVPHLGMGFSATTAQATAADAEQAVPQLATVAFDGRAEFGGRSACTETRLS